MNNRKKGIWSRARRGRVSWKLWIAFTLAGVGMVGQLGLGLSAAWAQTAPTPAVPKLKNVVWIWLENTPQATLGAQKYLRQVWQKTPSVRFTKYLPVSKVTQTNVMAMITGSDQGVPDNQLVRVFEPSIVDLLESKNIAWRVYVEDFPGSCYQGPGSGNYQRYRAPFISLATVQADRYLCSKLVTFRNLDEDIRFGQMPKVSVVIPNLQNSGATTSVADAEWTVRKILDPILETPEQLAETTVIVSTTNNTDVKRPEMYTLILGYGLKAPAQAYTQPVGHYQLLRTLQEGLRVGHLNQNDAKAEPLTGFWVE
jgi:hypothetical protein